MRVIFAGTPDFAARHLFALIEAEFDVVAAYTQPDRPAGRGKKLKPSEVKTLALEHKIPVCQPQSLKGAEAQTELRNWNADIMVVVAYGLILPQAVLDIPRMGCINVHGSLLPKWRGAAPIQRAIWAGDEQTGVTIMKMEAGLDTGPMLHKVAIDIEQTDTSASMYEKLAQVGPCTLVESLQQIDNWTPETQNNDDASYAKKLSKEEARIDWNLNAQQIERNCRAFNPWPVSWFTLNDVAIKVWEMQIRDIDCKNHSPGQIVQADKNGLLVATSTQPVLLTKIQIPGKKASAFADVFNARADWFKTNSQL